MSHAIDPGWADWIKHHGAVFGMTSTPDSETLYAWATVFDLANRTPDELIVATNRMALAGTRQENRWADKLQWREGHLHALKQALKDLDAVEAARVSAEALAARSGRSGNDCEACGDSGWVVVPQLERFGLKGSARTYRGTCAVLCRCHLGARRWETCRDLKGRRPFSLEQYEDLCNRAGLDWRNLARQQHEEAVRHAEQKAGRERAEGRAIETAQRADRLLGALSALCEMPA